MTIAQMSGGTRSYLSAAELDSRKAQMRSDALARGKTEDQFENEFQSLMEVAAVEDAKKRQRQSLITDTSGVTPTFGVPGSLDDFIAGLLMAEPGTEGDLAKRPWKQSLLLIKPTYISDVRLDGRPRRKVAAQVQRDDVTWLRFTDGTVAGLKEEELPDGQRKVIAVRTPDVDALVDLGSIEESEREKVQAIVDAPQRAEYEKLKAKFEGK